MFENAVLILQKALNAGGAGLKEDGKWGPLTSEAASKRAESDATKRGEPPVGTSATKVPQNEDLAHHAVQIALDHVGEREATGQNDGEYVDALEKRFGLHRDPWCAMEATNDIMLAAAELSVTPVLHKSASSTEIFSQAKAKGLLLDKPIPNCIGLLKGNGGSPGKTHHHTFLVVSIDDAGGVVHSVDGNWGNAVSRPVHKISDCDFVAIA